MKFTIKPRLSVVIVNCNGFEFTQACIKSVVKSKLNNKEIIVVDNGSQDESIAKLKAQFSDLVAEQKLILLSFDTNQGPAKARNYGVSRSQGEILAFLDNDTQVADDWDKIALELFARFPKLGVIQSKLLLAQEPNKIDYVGEFMGNNGFLVQVAPGGTIDTGQFDQLFFILAAKSAGMFIRRSTFDEINGFDEDYFIYVEETDLGWRSWLAGYQNIFLPNSVVYHESGSSSITLGQQKVNFNAKFHGCKNYILTLYKNLSLSNLVLILPWHVILWIGLAFFSLLKGNLNESKWILGGIWWNIVHLPISTKKRRIVQSSRCVSDQTLFGPLMKRKPFSYFLAKAINKHTLGNANSF